MEDRDSDRKMREIAYRELKNGKTPDELFTIALSSGIAREVVTREFAVISHKPDFAFAANALGEFLRRKQAENAPRTEKFWDPIGEEITRNTFHGVRYELEAKGKELVKRPFLPRRNLALCASPLVIAAAAFAFHPAFFPFLVSLGDGDGLALLFLLLVPPLLYIHHIFKLQRDLIKLMIANRQGWHYCPAESHERWLRFAEAYPEIFQKGNKDQNLQDEFWGITEGQGHKADFWSGIFEYVIETEGDKGRKNRQTKHCNVFALRLSKVLKCDFCLRPESLGAKIRNWFTRKEIDTESADFNRNFAVYYNGKKVEEELEIIKTLSPSVQMRLIEMKEQFGKFTLLFRRDVVLISFNGRLLKRMRTNFFRQVAVDTRDSEALTERLKSVLEVSADIARFLD